MLLTINSSYPSGSNASERKNILSHRRIILSIRLLDLTLCYFTMSALTRNLRKYVTAQTTPQNNSGGHRQYPRFTPPLLAVPTSFKLMARLKNDSCEEVHTGVKIHSPHERSGEQLTYFSLWYTAWRWPHERSKHVANWDHLQQYAE